MVFGSADSSIYCLHARTGRLLWRVKTGDPVLASPVITGGPVYIGSSDLTFRALDLATATGRVAFVGTTLGQVYALDVSGRRVRWVYQLGPDMLNTPRVVGRGRVLLRSVDGRLALLSSR